MDISKNVFNVSFIIGSSSCNSSSSSSISIVVVISLS